MSFSLAATISALRASMASAITSNAAFRSAPEETLKVLPARRALSASALINSCEFI